jgi:predicted transposase YbfD/YdcC
MWPSMARPCVAASRGPTDEGRCTWESAFAADGLGLVLGQVAVEDKSNEIEAIPELLRLLDLKGAVVTIDAMGAHKEIAAQILAQGGDYLLALKANHPNLPQDAQRLFADEATLKKWKAKESRAHSGVEKDHGRIEERLCLALPAFGAAGRPARTGCLAGGALALHGGSPPPTRRRRSRKRGAAFLSEQPAG